MSIFSGNGGMDVFNAGAGNDTIIINASNITALAQTGAGNRARVDGGGARVGFLSTNNQIIQAIAVDITCTGD
jgi:hypothetical protein